MKLSNINTSQLLPGWCKTKEIASAICRSCDSLVKQIDDRLDSLPMEFATRRSLLSDVELKALAQDLCIPFYFDEHQRSMRERVVFSFGNMNSTRGTASTLQTAIDLVFGEGSARVIENINTQRWKYKISIDASRAALSSNGRSIWRVRDLCKSVGRAAIGLESIDFDMNQAHANIAVCARVSYTVNSR